MKLTPTRRDYLTDLFTAAGFQAKTINRRGDVFLAKVRPIGGVANAPYTYAQFRLMHDQYNGDRLMKVG